MSLEMVKKLYAKMPDAVARARKKFGRGLTLTEKILVSHVDNWETQGWERGKAMLALRPDRVAMQDATAQMAMLQFMQAGKTKAAVPSTIHCDHLIGVRLTGKLQGWTASKDVILYICGLLTVKGGTNKILEYFGPGAATISCTGKGTITNMGAELGATTSVFPFDEKMAAYFRMTDRKEIAKLAEASREMLVADSEVEKSPEKYFDQIVEIDLSKLEPHVVGPHTPDLARPISKMAAEAKEKGYPVQLRAALIGSCTNSSYEDISRAAHIARQGLKAGLKAKTPFLVTPGSERIYHTMKRDGFLQTFEEMGGTVLANACGPCIGQWKRADAVKGRVDSIISSYNRNFPGRNDGMSETLSFLTSPEVVTADAFAGDLTFDPVHGALKTAAGKELKFEPRQGEELTAKGFASGEEGFVQPAENGDAIQVEIPPDSERLQLLQPFPRWDGKDFSKLPLLIKTKGKTTTDHISPAGPWLKYRGHLDKISDNMFLGAANAFYSEIGKGTDVLAGESGLTIAQIARRYKAQGIGARSAR